jgi:mannose-6-phosphate isomerase-like protein (cupin superfamily)
MINADKELQDAYDYLAPDGSEIRLLSKINGGGLAHCTLRPGGVSRAVTHRSVEEIWYVLSGRGELWRKDAVSERRTDLSPGLSVTICTGTHFQFLTVGMEPLRILIATIPRWPGPDEAVAVAGPWPEKPPETPLDPSIPMGLVNAIRAGRCVAFVGSGFSGAAKFPTWESLLRELAARSEVENIRPQIEERLKDKTSHAFDEVAQALEDVLGRDALIEHLRTKFTYAVPDPVMERRRQLLKEIPFRAVLTTNYDRTLKGEIPEPSMYRQLLRSVHTPWIGTLYVTAKDRKQRPLLKLHGDLDNSQTIVLTRRDYRRLLYENPNYLSFLREYLVSHTVLYLGYSFTDAYLNELRSELLTRLDQREGSEPVAYAVINNVSAVTQAHYRKHEGIEILTYETRDTPEGKDYSGFDRILEAINDLTNPVMRYRSLLAGKRLLWVDPRWEMNLRWTNQYFDMREGHEVLDLVRSAEEALERLATVAENGRAYDLMVCFWGDESGKESAQPQAVTLLGEMRSRSIGVPVVVFAERGVFQKRKRQALELAALGCYYRWESLLRAIQMALDPESETA